jgi:hypothetical protein
MRLSRSIILKRAAQSLPTKFQKSQIKRVPSRISQLGRTCVSHDLRALGGEIHLVIGVMTRAKRSHMKSHHSVKLRSIEGLIC